MCAQTVLMQTGFNRERKKELCFRRALVRCYGKKRMKERIQSVIELDGQDRHQCPALAWHRGVFIVLGKICGRRMLFVECLNGQVAAGQYHGGREGMRGKDIMEQDYGEKEI